MNTYRLMMQIENQQRHVYYTSERISRGQTVYDVWQYKENSQIYCLGWCLIALISIEAMSEEGANARSHAPFKSVWSY